MNIRRTTTVVPTSGMAPCFQRLSEERFLVEMTGLELLALRAITGVVSGDQKLFPRAQTDGMYNAAREVLAERLLPEVPDRLFASDLNVNPDVARRYIEGAAK